MMEMGTDETVYLLTCCMCKASRVVSRVPPSGMSSWYRIGLDDNRRDYCPACISAVLERLPELEAAERERDEARAAVERLVACFGCDACDARPNCHAQKMGDSGCIDARRKWAYGDAPVPKHQAVAMLEKVIARIGWRLCPNGMGVGKEGCRIPVSDDGQRWESMAYCTPCWREACGLPAEWPEKDGGSGE